MKKYPRDYNPILEYWQQINNGKIIVPDLVGRTYRKIAHDLTDNDSPFFYSHARANHRIEFDESFCRHSKGKWGGQPVELMLWQKAMYATIFGFIDINGNRKYRESILVIGKKNGKSFMSSTTGLYGQVADGESGPEIYSVATTKDQAKIVWGEAKRIRNKSPALSSRIRALVGEMLSDFNDGVFKPLASDKDTLDGLNVYYALMDEWHQWKYGIALYDIMADGMSARDQPLIFATSTAGTVREDIYDIKRDYAVRVINGYFDPSGYKDERLIAFLYELDKREEWTNPDMWIKANPGLGVIKNHEALAEKVERAKENPSMVKNLLCKEFNIRETSTDAWLSFETLNNTDTFDIAKLKPRYGIGGLDLSETTDLTCATLAFMVPGDDVIYVEQMYWLPADLLDKRVREDKVPYDLWHDAGWLRLSEGNRVNYKDVVAWFAEMQNDKDIYVYKIGYDSWNSTYVVDEMQSMFGKLSTEAIIQGKKSMSTPMKNFESDLGAKKINYNNNPILKWCLTNASSDTDKNGNISLIKSRNPRKRIDGVASVLDAYIALERYKDDYLRVI